jgi:hypothetical protein
MTSKIETHSVGKGIVDSSWVLLTQTADTALIFKPQIHSGGVRGVLIKFKKERGQSWEELTERSFISLDLHEGVKIELNTESTKKLFDAIYDREQIAKLGIERGDQEYITAPANQVVLVNDRNKSEVLKQLIENNTSDEFWNLLRDSNPELATHLARSQIQASRIDVLNKFTERLTKQYTETTGADSWQKWIYSHTWLFGVQYLSPFEKTKINLSGSMPDYLFPTVDGFLDVLEIKLPEDEVIIADTSHAGAFKWSPETNIAIGQVVNYLSDIEHFRYELQEKILKEYKVEVSIIKPRAFILIGNKEHWLKEKKEALRKMNHALHGIEVLTYYDLLQRGKETASMFSGV